MHRSIVLPENGLRLPRPFSHLLPGFKTTHQNRSSVAGKFTFALLRVNPAKLIAVLLLIDFFGNLLIASVTKRSTSADVACRGDRGCKRGQPTVGKTQNLKALFS
jgi:hypothetical protein